MKVPKILYHGTTALRWSFIKKDGLLRCNMPKSYEAEEILGFSTGYVYLTTNLDEAIMYGLNKSLQDMAYLHIDQKTHKLGPNYRDPVVLGINGFKLGNNLEIDPQVNTSLVQQIHDFTNAQWYRYKGDIKLKHLHACKYVSFDIFSSNLIDGMMEINEKKFNAGQLVMKQLCK
jgi:hypothetical protein